MTWLVTTAVTNAVLVMFLAAIALIVGRLVRRPALVHLLWTVVLLKLLTPPMVELPVGWSINPTSWLGESQDSSTFAGASTASGAAASEASEGADAGTSLAAPAAASAMQSSAVTIKPRISQRSRAEVIQPEQPLASATASLQDGRAEHRRTTPFSIAHLLYAAVAIWALGSIVILTLLLVRTHRFRRFLRLAADPDARLTARARQLAYVVGLRGAPDVIVVNSVVSPMLWGLGRRMRLVFPMELRHRLDAAARDSLLLHELAHYARGDHWTRLVELAAYVLYWWHPVVWFARRQIEAAEEQCCDAWVVEFQTGTRRSYAEALLATIDFLSEKSALPPPAACGLGGLPLLRCRLIQIMRGDVPRRLPPLVKAAVVVAAILVLPLGPGLRAASSSSIANQAVVERASRANSIKAERDSTPPAAPAAITSLEEAEQNIATSPKPTLRRTTTPTARAQLSPPLLWATATSPGGKYKLEARTGRSITLVNVRSNLHIDLSSHAIDCVAFSPDDRVFATGHEGSIVRLWDSETGGTLALLRGGEDRITSIEFSPDNRHLAAGAANGCVLVWNLAMVDEVAAKLIDQQAPISCVRWSRAGDRLAVTVGAWTDDDHASVLVWSPMEDSILASYPLEKPAGAVEWLADQSLLVAAWDRSTTMWDLTTGRPSRAFEIDKDQVSASHWSPNCPLISSRLSDSLARGSIENDSAFITAQ